jgi:hypothetical protein
VIKSRGLYYVTSIEGAIAKFLEANIKSNRVNNSTLVYNMESVEFDFLFAVNSSLFFYKKNKLTIMNFIHLHRLLV